jgi:hypothetical protein
MNIWSLVKRFNFKQILRLSVVVLQNPLLIYPTIKATKRAMTICDLQYGNAHHKNGKANAFRHALWNMLICRNAFRITKKKEKAIDWAQKITDLHEKIAPNLPIETAMDLHNNEIGRIFYLKFGAISEKEMIVLLKDYAQIARELTDIKTIPDYKNDLVYLSEKE